VPDQTGNGCNKDNTVVIEEDQVLTTNVATKRQKLHLKVSFALFGSCFYMLL